MNLCFIEPEDAIRAIASSIGADSRHQLIVEAIRCWVDGVPEDELEHHYAKVVSGMDDEDLTMLAAWHASLDVGTPIATRDFLVGAYDSLGKHRRDALRIAAAFQGENGLGNVEGDEEEALLAVLPWLSEERMNELAAVALEIYIWDRLGTEN